VWIRLVSGFRIKPVTDEQVFYDKFLCDKLYLPSARVYVQQILYDKFSCDRVLFTGVNVSEKGVYRRHDRKIIIVRYSQSHQMLRLL
jgi:hypothetical protein